MFSCQHKPTASWSPLHTLHSKSRPTVTMCYIKKENSWMNQRKTHNREDCLIAFSQFTEHTLLSGLMSISSSSSLWALKLNFSFKEGNWRETKRVESRTVSIKTTQTHGRRSPPTLWWNHRPRRSAEAWGRRWSAHTSHRGPAGWGRPAPLQHPPLRSEESPPSSGPRLLLHLRSGLSRLSSWLHLYLQPLLKGVTRKEDMKMGMHEH